jgi:hypothetical protein
MTEPVPPPPENLRLAYQELCKSYQSIVDFRAKLLGFLPLASGVGFFALLGDGKDPVPYYAWVAGLFGFAITLGLFFYELRGLQRSATLERTGKQLEAELGIGQAGGQFSVEPAPHLHGFVDARGAAWLIYPAVLAGWAYIAGLQRLGVLWATVAGIIVAAAITFWLAPESGRNQPPRQPTVDVRLKTFAYYAAGLAISHQLSAISRAC